MINIPDAYKDHRFNQNIAKQTNYTTKSILCHPVCADNGETCVGVVQLINKNNGAPFTVEDEKLLAAFLSIVGEILKRLTMSKSPKKKKPSWTTTTWTHGVRPEGAGSSTLLMKTAGPRRATETSGPFACRVVPSVSRPAECQRRPRRVLAVKPIDAPAGAAWRLARAAVQSESLFYSVLSLSSCVKPAVRIG